ncbi:MAG: AGE family epimerase/isomerase [Spirochaetaceae bacterium]|nr:AGE family epimerase/isomerase [Spirochaetaceae bacterium]
MESKNFPFTKAGMISHAKEIILPYWEKFACHKATGGFYGSIDNNNQQDETESRSIVMTARYLWAYSASARQLGEASYLNMADYAYNTIINNFIDKEYGGVFWSVKPDGSPDVAKKQIYGEAFAIYGLSEYAAALIDFDKDKKLAERAMKTAIELFSFLEQYALDKGLGGYVEARARNWAETDDLKLSPKDIDCNKSMNTNLHVMEAYTNLFRTLPVVFPEEKTIHQQIASSLAELARVTVKYILNKENHLVLYFNQDWSGIGNVVSYGHDIEASWLLQEAVEELADKTLIAEVRDAVLGLAKVSLEQGYDFEKGGLYNELGHGKLDKTRIWWNQAEAVTGFYNAYHMTGDEKYLSASEKTWQWICQKQTDYDGGDWFAAVTPDGEPILTENKGGNWKTAYHNVRACLEMARRLKK